MQRSLIAGASALACVVVSVMPAEAARVAAAIITCNDRGCSDRTPAVAPAHVHAVLRTRRVRHVEKSAHQVGRENRHEAVGLVTVSTVIGKAITVSHAIEDRMLSFIADLKIHGYVPHRISCYARGGHVTHSRHYSGNACDFDGSLSIAPFLRTREADELIRAHGLHNGCDYLLHGVRDCGHIDDRVGFVSRWRRHRRVARR